MMDKTDKEHLDSLSGTVLIISWIGIPVAIAGFFGWPTGVLTLVMLSIGILFVTAHEMKKGPTQNV